MADIYEIELDGNIYTVEADSEAEAMAAAEAQAGPAPTPSMPQEEIPGLLPIPDGIISEPVESGSGLPSLSPGTAGATGALLSTGALKFTEPLRRGVRAGLRGTASTAATIGAKAPGILGSSIGSGVGAGLFAATGMSPFMGGTLGATAGGAAGHFLHNPLERMTRVAEGALSTQPVSETAARVYDIAADPKLAKAQALVSDAKTQLKRGSDTLAEGTAIRASQMEDAAKHIGRRAAGHTRTGRGVVDAIFGKAGAGGKLGPSKVLPAVGAALGAYELYAIAKDLYDRTQAGEDIPASEMATAGGLGILGLLPGMSSAAKGARTLARGGRAGIRAAEGAADASRVMRAGRPPGPTPGGRMSGAGGNTGNTETLREMVKREADEMGEAAARRVGGGARTETTPLRDELVRGERQSATQAVGSGQGPSGGRRGVEVAGARRGTPVSITPENVHRYRNLDDLIRENEELGLNPNAAAHRIGEWMRARGVSVEGATLPRPKK